MAPTAVLDWSTIGILPGERITVQLWQRRRGEGGAVELDEWFSVREVVGGVGYGDLICLREHKFSWQTSISAVLPLYGYSALVGPILRWGDDWVEFSLVPQEGSLHYPHANSLVVPVPTIRWSYWERVAHHMRVFLVGLPVGGGFFGRVLGILRSEEAGLEPVEALEGASRVLGVVPPSRDSLGV